MKIDPSVTTGRTSNSKPRLRGGQLNTRRTLGASAIFDRQRVIDPFDDSADVLHEALVCNGQ